MPDPIEVEVVCKRCGGGGDLYFTVPECCGQADPSGECCGNPVPVEEREPCRDCDGKGIETRTLAPDSLAALKIELADAVDCASKGGLRLDLSFAVELALAAVRNHPDYREVGNG